MRENIAEKYILDIKNTFCDMHPITDAKRGIMQTGVIESIWAEGSTALTCSIRERTALEER